MPPSEAEGSMGGKNEISPLSAVDQVANGLAKRKCELTSRASWDAGQVAEGGQ